MRIDVVPVTMFFQNCMVLSMQDGGPCVVVDPGGDIPRVLDVVGRRRLTIEGILVTHGHIDHVGGIHDLLAVAPVHTWFDPRDRAMWEDPGAGMFPFDPIPVPSDATEIGGGETIAVAGMRFEVLHTPGHSPGSVSFVADGHVLCGDVLFNGSVGRTDIPGASFDTLVRSIETQLWTLPDETRVWPGHGRPTTIGFEKRANPFVGSLVR